VTLVANFMKVQISHGQSGGFDESANILKVRLNSSTRIGLWGAGPLPDALPLFPVDLPDATNPGAVRITEIKTGARELAQKHVRVFEVRGVAAGGLTLEARIGSTSGANYVMPAKVHVTTADHHAEDLGKLSETRARGRLILNNALDRQIFDAGHKFSGKSVIYAGGLIRLLLQLTTRGTVAVMSLVRPVKGGPHGEIQANGDILCRAVDIAAYKGTPVTLIPPAVAIRVVCDLIGDFPAGLFDLGFPRPIGGPTGFDPSQDVFFPVPDVATAQQCFDGEIVRKMGQMLEPARTAVSAAMSRSAATFGVLFPDGLNHLHVKAVPGGFNRQS
jgi:hypothetical protein